MTSSGTSSCQISTRRNSASTDALRTRAGESACDSNSPQRIETLIGPARFDRRLRPYSLGLDGPFHGRGGFRTCDLSRVKTRAFPGAEAENADVAGVSALGSVVAIGLDLGRFTGIWPAADYSTGRTMTL
jgi:hypothetical protein